ncbi:hypothetical protein CDL15_Pgr026458 [Punica granatum]|uniref:Uncharacterized protein n=1 Tax=Punica granatum TaxID=22663 RepID=A0A218XH78_PUNGR|nr:hypothetical protein CDL15_Pgr026458 [Punica granatum]
MLINVLSLLHQCHLQEYLLPSLNKFGSPNVTGVIERYQHPSSNTPVPVTSATSARHPARPCPSPAPPAPVIQHARALHQRHQRPSSSTPVPVTVHANTRHPDARRRA